jgi:biotin operon repressor
MINLSDAGVSQAEIRQRLGFPRTTVNSVIINRQKILAEIKSATSVNTIIIIKRG